MRRNLLYLLLVFTSIQINAQNNTTWKTTSPSEILSIEKIRSNSFTERVQLYRVDLNEIKNALINATDKFSGKPGVEVSFPNMNGEIEKYLVWENSNFEPALQEQFPDIKAFVGKSISDKTAKIHFSLSPYGIQTMVLRGNNQNEFIESYTTDNSVYALFNSLTKTNEREPFKCHTDDKILIQNIENGVNLLSKTSDQLYRTMRLALSCTAEYTTYHGGTKSGALSAMNATMTRINAVYEKDLSLHLNIIANNTDIIYTDANTDPYSPASIGALEGNQFKPSGWSNQLQKTLTSVIGNSNYDIGHLFGATGGGGYAGCIGCVCVNDGEAPDGIQTKGKGFTSPANGKPEGAFFDIDFVAHEMGHQLGAQHTFTFQLENIYSQVEPGSGSTIMGYAGITDYDVQLHSDPYFTSISITQIQNNLITKTCPETTVITNPNPNANAGLDYKIPAETAYILKGTATASNGDALTYCWEQNDPIKTTDVSGSTGAKSEAYPEKTAGPNYRSFPPTTSPNRYMPELDTVLSGQLSTTWESVSSVSRILNFELTVRDNNIDEPQTSSDIMKVTSSMPYNSSTGEGIGPFSVTSQSATGINWVEGSSQIITWNVNNTTSLSGSLNVNIKLSIDGGKNFNYILASNMPNDGEETIIVPDVPSISTNCRILIEPTDNIYYAVNFRNFKISPNLSNEDFNLANFSLYPNPNKGSFNLKFESVTSNEIAVNVYDLRGRSVYTDKYQNTGLFNQNITLNTIQPGIYILNVKDGDRQVDKKIVVE
ncbi:MAG TPA: zinc-dependent metalloprotease family protein [Flavobacterium sp.]|nr:zinc-dependent metalloprotease family protein [Flavobacterium sp.]